VTDVPLLVALSNQIAPALFFTLDVHRWVGIGALAISALALGARRMTPRATAVLAAIWFGAFWCLLVYYTTVVSLAQTEIGPFAPLPLGAAILFSVGIVWELVKSGAEWSKASSARVYGLVALLIVTLGISAALFGGGSSQVNLVSTLNSFYGVLFIGIPFLGLTLLAKAARYEPVSGFQLAALFFLGWVGAVPLLLWNSGFSWGLALMPLWWLLVLWLFGKRLARLESALDGIVAGGALAMGFVTMWIVPQQVLVPFITPLHELQRPLNELFKTRLPLDWGEFYFALLALIVGGFVGGIWTRPARTLYETIGAVALACLLPLGAFALVNVMPTHALSSNAALTPTPNAWQEFSLDPVGLRISAPREFQSQPQQGSLLNLVNASNDTAIVISQLQQGIAPEDFAARFEQARRDKYADFQIVTTPAWDTSQSFKAYTVAWDLTASPQRGEDLFVVTPRGVLWFALYTTDEHFAARAELLKQIAATLR
jgi:hypothetical protein